MKKADPVQHTIDKKHGQMLEEFHTNETVHIPELLTQKKSLKSQVRSLNSDQIEQYMELKDRIAIINTTIKDMKLQKKRYLLDNSKHIFNYFEEKKQISSGGAKNVNVLNNFFKVICFIIRILT
jgi:hypothetical protein